MENKDYEFLKKKSIKLKEKISFLISKKKNQKDENEIKYYLNILEKVANKMEIIINSQY